MDDARRPSDRLYRGGFLVASVAAVGRRLVRGYLWHWTPVRAGIDGWSLVAVQGGCTLAIAIASFFLIEQPVRRGAGTKRQWSVAIPALVTVLVLAIVISTAGATGPPTARAVQQRLDRAVVQARQAPTGTQRVMVVGDSVGWYLGDALGASEVTGNRVVANLSLLACVFPSGASAVRYTAFQEVRPNPPGRACTTQVAGIALRPVGVHFKGFAAAAVARWILLQL